MGEQEATENTTSNNFDQILNLFDLYWFHHSIFRFTPPPPPPPPPEPIFLDQNTDDQSDLLTPLSRPIHQHRRTRSDETMSTSSAPAPALKPPPPPRLRTIPSGKEALTDLIPSSSDMAAAAAAAAERRRRLSNRRMKRRSMSELELEELKGLIDLGFEFPETEVEKDPRIADIVPGLRKRRISEGGGGGEIAGRPYLSEAWRFRDDDERSQVLRDWSVLANGDERDVKEQLRQWAHVVASTVR